MGAVKSHRAGPAILLFEVSSLTCLLLSVSVRCSVSAKVRENSPRERCRLVLSNNNGRLLPEFRS